MNVFIYQHHHHPPHYFVAAQQRPHYKTFVINICLKVGYFSFCFIKWNSKKVVVTIVWTCDYYLTYCMVYIIDNIIHHRKRTSVVVNIMLEIKVLTNTVLYSSWLPSSSSPLRLLSRRAIDYLVDTISSPPLGGLFSQ